LPEGDTIWRTAVALRRRIEGKVVTDARPAAIARLKGRRVERVEPNGKHLLMRFEGGIALHSHMRMIGLPPVEGFTCGDERRQVSPAEDTPLGRRTHSPRALRAGQLSQRRDHSALSQSGTLSLVECDYLGRAWVTKGAVGGLQAGA